MEVNDYLLSHEGLDWHALIEPWRWIFPEEVEFQPWLMNKFGDLTWIDGTGAVFHLNVSEGTLEKVAENEDQFLDLLEDPDNAAEWLMYPLVDMATAAGMTLENGECFGYEELPVLGGEYDTANIAIYALDSYWKFCGDMHNKLQDVPDDDDEEFEEE
ncbi:Domain of unknown function DUF1851 [Pirellula staleyi DSM 6068]|uniref:T6SS immunity protein Tdi1 C-terminal domain-containing protein n=1 Tax=Pirellula staleyi (strain ATCC 27377 / DSM 6068 / ICPB 4128) TaxID=530564 RepID=D2QYS6_PIRSD|nr:DUF1851 domain-containing protein [Pirellula staleyi]ADB16381.1 Domain of unknown function DUF1851 [Pirellula staleyi DSM 6068]